MTLSQITLRALADARRSGQPVGVYNLNRAGAALYVMRDFDESCRSRDSFVCVAMPSHRAFRFRNRWGVERVLLGADMGEALNVLAAEPRPNDPRGTFSLVGEVEA